MLVVESYGMTMNKSAKEGFVYILQPLEATVYKIGHTVSLKNRIRLYRKKYKFPVRYLITIPTNDCEQLEAYLQKEYRAYRLTGEWYLLPDSVLNRLRKIERQAKEDL